MLDVAKKLLSVDPYQLGLKHLRLSFNDVDEIFKMKQSPETAALKTLKKWQNKHTAGVTVGKMKATLNLTTKYDNTADFGQDYGKLDDILNQYSDDSELSLLY